MPYFPPSNVRPNDGQDPLPQEPDMRMLQQLLGQDAETRGLEQPGDPASLMGKGAQLQGALPSISTTDLISGMNDAQGNKNMDVMRALRGIIEQRTPDDIARGPKDAGKGLTTSESNETGWRNPFAILTNALSGRPQQE